jgi:hypothetical protein
MKIEEIYNLEELQYMVEVVQRHQFDLQRSKSWKSSVNDHRDVLDFEKVMMKEEPHSRVKVNTSRHSHGVFQGSVFVLNASRMFSFTISLI